MYLGESWDPVSETTAVHGGEHYDGVSMKWQLNLYLAEELQKLAQAV